MTFSRNTLLSPFALAWNAAAVVIGAASFFGIDSQIDIWTRILGATCVFLVLTLIRMTVVARNLFQRAKTPVTIRTVLEGTHFYSGRLIVILDKSNWIEPGQLLALVANSDGVQIPLGLLTVETMTTEGFPQCVVAIPLTNERLSSYLADRSRWRSLSALPDIKSRYLEVPNNG